MKCSPCHRNIRPGQESDKRIEVWRQADGILLAFGPSMDAGVVADARGVLVEAWHNKCWYIAERRTQRGADAVLGSELAQAALAMEDDDL